jgi:hypothetical protein
MSETLEAFDAGVRALRENRATDAVASFELLADQGTYSATASFNRGLAYAMRVSLDGEIPGDLGQAAAGFEEALLASPNGDLRRDSEAALATIRSSVARRASESGITVVTPAPPLAVTVTSAIGENSLAAVALLLSIALCICIWNLRHTHGRIRAIFAALFLIPALTTAITFMRTARNDRVDSHYAVIVRDRTPLSGNSVQTLVEGLRVKIEAERGELIEVRFGDAIGTIPRDSIRRIAKP